MPPSPWGKVASLIFLRGYGQYGEASKDAFNHQQPETQRSTTTGFDQWSRTRENLREDNAKRRRSTLMPRHGRTNLPIRLWLLPGLVA